MKTLLTAALAVIAGFVVGNTPAQARTVGSGHLATETRAASGFDAIALSGSMDLVVRQAATEGVRVEADDNLLPLIETVVESGAQGRTLAIRVKRGESFGTHKKITVSVDVVKLGSIETSGSGDVTVEGLKTPALRLAIAGSSDARLSGLATDHLDLRIAGSGDVVAAGSARQLKIGIAGSGDADTAGLAADDVSVSIAGSGDANVTANKSLEVSVAGSGDVRYGGDVASVKASMAGSGSVQRR